MPRTSRNVNGSRVCRSGAAALWWVVAALTGACGGSTPKPGGEQSPYVLYPPPPAEARLQFLASYSSEQDVLNEQNAFQEFVLGEKKYREMGKPYGVAIHDGKIYAADTLIGLVWVVDVKNRTFGTLGLETESRLGKPVNVDVDAQGLRYVADVRHKRIMVYDGSGKYVRAYGDPEAWSPSDVMVDDKYLYVSDVKGGQVVIIEKESGKELRRIGKKGSNDGELFFPTNLAMDKEGNIFVTDTGNFRVVKFSRNGKYLQKFGSLGRSLGQFARPKGLAVDHEGRLYVADAAFENVQIFGPDGKLLLFFGQAGNHPGGINLPAGVTIDYDNVGLFADRVAPGYAIDYLILVSSQYGKNKVNVYAFLKKKEGAGEAPSP